MTNDLERTMRMNYLYDFYHSLLTEKQQRYVEMYYLEDLQLTEIAENLDVTRQAVYDNLKRTSELLEHYEKNLSMYKNYLHRVQLLETLKEKLGEVPSDIEKIFLELEELD